jgi:hypothetical protein
MFPDYIGQLQTVNILEIGDLVIKFYIVLIIYMFTNVVFMVGFVWNLLFICRLLGIPWFDGSTKGFINRTKHVKE